jgi:hypothetical protein
MATVPVPRIPGLSDAVNPTPFASAFPLVDTFSILNTPMPGKWTLIRAERRFKYQIQAAYGFDYANALPIGADLVEATFKGEFWAQADAAFYRTLRNTILAKPLINAGFTSFAMGITHPELAALGVTAVVLSKIGILTSDGFGGFETELSFLEYHRPTPAPPKVSSAIPDVAPKKPTVVDAQDAEIRANMATVQGLLSRI